MQEILRGEKNYIKTRRENIVSFIELLVIFELWSIIAVQNGGWLILAIFVLFPFFGLWAMMMFRFGFKFNFFKAIQHTRWLSSSNLSLVISSHLIMLVIGWLFFSLANSFLMNFYLWMIGWNLSYLNQSQLDSIVVIVMTFVAAFSFFLIFALFLTSVSFVFYSLLEINEANSLLNKIEQIGMSRKIRGMIRE